MIEIQTNYGPALSNWYTLYNRVAKWNILKRLFATRNRGFKNVAQLTGKIGYIHGEIDDLEITMTEMVVIHVLHNLDPKFDR